jgi:hypothetical protein
MDVAIGIRQCAGYKGSLEVRHGGGSLRSIAWVVQEAGFASEKRECRESFPISSGNLPGQSRKHEQILH